MVRRAEPAEVDQRYTVEAQWEQLCPDECGYMIEPGDLITPIEGDYDTIWVLAEHPGS